MAEKPKRRPQLTDAERHDRFVKTAREVEAAEDSDAFDRAFASVAQPPKKPSREKP